MGMDVYGIAPDSPEGEYFRASVWGWYPILDLIADTGIFTDEEISLMGTNEGAGAKDAETAIRLADALDAMLEGVRPDGEFLSTSDRSTKGTGAIALGIMEMLGTMRVSTNPNPDDTILSPEAPVFSADVDFVREFSNFCRHSGGFRIL